MKMKIFVGGMNCFHCVDCVSEALTDIGAKDVDVSYIKSFATIEIADDTTDKVIKSAIEDAGYEVLGLEQN
ncbi:heavy-metal-associated domain-containing protein [Clostridium sp.]|uniref:heavy-metal-associated domain-containing protein n=1 Tax=Clostridium sp. TaxID=1506 RepID=UPI00261BEA92|nr:heavy-metal-associated domain-containing protein [uncultured Clostridium sp.]